MTKLEEIKDFTEYSYLKYHGLEPEDKKHVNTGKKSGVKFYWYYYQPSELLEHYREQYRRQADDKAKILQYRDNLKD